MNLNRPISPAAMRRHNYVFMAIRRSLILITFLLFGLIANAGSINVLKTGLGNGTVEITAGATSPLLCGGDCEGAYTDGAPVTIEARPDANSVFLGWRGTLTSNNRVFTFTTSGNVSLRPVFGVRESTPGVNPIPDLLEANINPAGIQAFLSTNRAVNNAARFIKALPLSYKQNWILMTRSESLQTGTAKYPRIIMPGPGARNVFSIGLVPHASFPGAHPLAIEYMQFDDDAKTFRFHEIILGDIGPMGVFPQRPSAADRVEPRKFIEVDDRKCFSCHTTRNLPNSSPYPGTTGVDPSNPAASVKGKPNWDAYDSWAGMLPFNRDRIYQGSLEARAYKRIFNLWNWRGTDESDFIRQILEQLYIQSPNIAPGSVHRIVRDTNATDNDLHIRFGFDGQAPLPTTNMRTNYTFGGPATAATDVPQGGRYVTLRHTDFGTGTVNENLMSPGSDEGRGVIFFDQLGGLKGTLNQERIADELSTFLYATGSHPIEIRPLAIAIARGLIVFSGDSLTVVRSGGAALSPAPNYAFFTRRHGNTNLRDIARDTRDRMRSLPRRKAELQKSNVDHTFPDGTDGGTDFDDDPYLVAPINGLNQEYGSSPGRMSIEAARNEILRRPRDLGVASVTVNYTTGGGAYVDRELYGSNVAKVAIFRYFLEPLGVPVDKWNMGVRGRSRTYTFADIFTLGRYSEIIDDVLSQSIRDEPRGLVLNPADDNAIITAAIATMNLSIDPLEVPKYTDVQRIFNKACIECHGGLDYPPYFGFGPSGINFSENENPTGALQPDGLRDDRMYRSFQNAIAIPTTILRKVNQIDEGTPAGMMPYGGPKLSQADVETIRRWVEPPSTRPYSVGDPHILTVNGISYDFQAAGEFVLLRGDYVQIQTRQKASAAAPFGPNAHTGLKTCVSVNSAVAIGFYGHRITYQPVQGEGENEQSLELRIDGAVVRLSELPKTFSPSIRIRRTSADQGIQIEGPGGSIIILTPGRWAYGPWISVDVRHLRAAEGLMGTVHPGNWLPSLPDGSQLGPIPKSLSARYKLLYGVFAEAWRVTDSSSLFDYPSGRSTADYTISNWPGGESPNGCVPPNEPPLPLPSVDQATAEARCADITDPIRRALCVGDIMATGDVQFAEGYLAADKILRNHYPEAPKLTFPANYQSGLKLPIKFTWDQEVDADGDHLDYRILVWPIRDLPDNNVAIEIGGSKGWFGGDGSNCWWIIGLIALALILLLYLLLRKKKKLFTLLALLVLIVAAALIVRCRTPKEVAREFTMTELNEGKSYYWKVITEDGNGGVTESEVFRFELE